MNLVAQVEAACPMDAFFTSMPRPSHALELQKRLKRQEGAERDSKVFAEDGLRRNLAAGVGAACPVDAHRLGGVQLLLQLLHNVHGPVLGLDHRKPAELQQHTLELSDCCSSATVMVMRTSLGKVESHTNGHRLDTKELALDLPEETSMSIWWIPIFEHQKAHRSKRQPAPSSARSRPRYPHAKQCTDAWACCPCPWHTGLTSACRAHRGLTVRPGRQCKRRGSPPGCQGRS